MNSSNTISNNNNKEGAVSGNQRFEVKTPKGTRDFGPREMAIRDRVISILTRVFKRFGALPMDTPVFELREILVGKYGEDSKLIYDLQDQGGELCSLRYDLTVPFARYMAMNKQRLGGSLKRYQIGKVYRRDQPALSRGRYREFYQCDLDIAGANLEPLVPDAEVVKMLYTGLAEILGGSDQFLVRLNNRKLLDGLMEYAGVPVESLRPISSAIDKLDKLSLDEVKREMVDLKGLDPEAADRIGEFAMMKGNGPELVEKLLASDLASNAKAKEGLEELKVLFGYLEVYGVLDAILFDMSLARGLDYYTGVIFEAIIPQQPEVGTVFGGGRYDNLVGMFCRDGQGIPCVGGSFGMERLFTVLESRLEKSPEGFRESPADVLIVSVGDQQAQLLTERMNLANRLWEAGINTELVSKRNAKLLDQFAYGEQKGIPLVAILGESELAAGQVKIRSTTTREESLVALDAIIEAIRERL